jgi:glycosyltransferase involved in cell wall biosynthesis
MSSCRVDQVLDVMEFGDAISNEAQRIQTRLRERGFVSNIFARVIGTRVRCVVDDFGIAALSGADAAIYHYATASTLGHAVAAMSIPSLMIYHNVTPPSFFAAYDREVAEVLARAQTELPQIANGFTHLVADSAFSARQLLACTGLPAGVLPVAADYERFDAIAKRRSTHVEMRAAHWLAVGRIAPNKGLHRLIAAFGSFLFWEPEAKLTICGAYRPTDPFHLALRAEIARLGLTDRVILTGSVSEAELLACFAEADIYVTLSEHEGFCVPLVEAMASDLPIVASVSSAIPETLGTAGLMVEDDATALEIAALVHLILTDRALAENLVMSGRERRKDFSAAAIDAALDRVIDNLTSK